MPTHQSYKLNNKQLHLLKLIYKFRFVTTSLLAGYKERSETTTSYLALRNLVEQGYIGRTFDTTYKLRGKSASYHLLAKGIGILKTHAVGTPKGLRSIYKDKNASDQFIEHCLALFMVYNRLRLHYGSRLKYFAKSELTAEDYEYFPQPLPDAYISLEGETHVSEFFLDYFSTTRPFFVMTNRIQKYVEYAEQNEWEEGSPLPIVLVVCETQLQEQRLHKSLRKLTVASELVVYTTSAEKLTSTREVWSAIDEPNVLFALDSSIVTYAISAPGVFHGDS